MLCLFSCTTVNPVVGFTPQTIAAPEIQNPYFSDPTIDYVYKLDILVNKRTMSGILVIKKIRQGTHRILCTSQFGSTLFDIEIHPTGTTVHYIFEALDKKIILRTLIQDFSLLTEEITVPHATYTNDTDQVLQATKDKQDTYYFYKQPTGVLYTIKQLTRRKEKLEIQFHKIAASKSDSITITHHNFPLRMELNTLTP